MVVPSVGGPLRSCQPGHADFPNCLSGVHPVNHIGEQEQSRLALGMGSHGGVGVDGSTATSAGEPQKIAGGTASRRVRALDS